MITQRSFMLAVTRIIIGLLLSFGVLCFVWSFEPPPSATYERTQLTPEVPAGGIFRIHISVVWTKTCWSKLYRTIVDGGGKVTNYEGELRKNIKGKHDFILEVIVPTDATPGEGVWKVRTDWYCNPWQWQFPKSVDLEPLTFKIIPRKEGAYYGRLTNSQSSCTANRCRTVDLLGGEGPN